MSGRMAQENHANMRATSMRASDVPNAVTTAVVLGYKSLSFTERCRRSPSAGLLSYDDVLESHAA